MQRKNPISVKVFAALVCDVKEKRSCYIETELKKFTGEYLETLILLCCPELVKTTLSTELWQFMTLLLARSKTGPDSYLEKNLYLFVPKKKLT